jgi:hypothetical protein
MVQLLVTALEVGWELHPAWLLEKLLPRQHHDESPDRRLQKFQALGRPLMVAALVWAPASHQT